MSPFPYSMSRLERLLPLSSFRRINTPESFSLSCCAVPLSLHCVCVFSLVNHTKSNQTLWYFLALLPIVAWYDSDLKTYQKDRQEGGELIKRFEERGVQQQQSVELSAEHLRKKSSSEQETEWQRQVKSKKGEDYYKNLKEVRSDPFH